MKVRGKIIGARHAISQIVTMVNVEDPRTKIPQRAANTLLNLCQAEGAADVIYNHIGKLLLTVSSSAHAELNALVAQVIEQVHARISISDIDEASR